MNCKQTEELLPLYAAGDLAEKRAASVTAHLKGCPGCAQVADQYRGTFQMTQQLTSPVFSEEVFAKLHRNVFNEIEAQAGRPSISDLFFGWLSPRTTWAVASALVVAFAVLAIYFVANRQAGNESTANNQGVPTNNESSQSPAPNAPSAPSTGSSATGTETPRRLKPRKVHSRRSGQLMAKVHESPLTTLKVSPTPHSSEPNSVPVNDSVQERPLRVEIQTGDPNIRIIWFTQSNTKPTPNSKGT